jgi:hypothetical protein
MVLLLFEQYAIVFIRGRYPFFLNGQAIRNIRDTEYPPLRVCRIRIHRICNFLACRIRKNYHESGSFRQQAKKIRKSGFVEVCNFLLHLWRRMLLCYFQYLISLESHWRKSRFRIRIRNSVIRIRIRLPHWSGTHFLCHLSFLLTFFSSPQGWFILQTANAMHWH